MRKEGRAPVRAQRSLFRRMPECNVEAGHGRERFVSGLIVIKSTSPRTRTLSLFSKETPMTVFTRTTLAVALACAALPAAAQSRGDWHFTVGVHQVNPKSDNGKLVNGTLPLEIDSNVRPTVTAEYFIRDNLGIEILAALPFEHDVDIKGLGTVASVKHLPPTFSLQYHFNSAGKVSPFVGAGLNYTTFFSEDTRGPLAGSDISLDDSWGAALHAGVDFRIGDRGALRLDARWIDIDSDVRLDGADVGTANIDPLVYGVAWRFSF